MKEKGFVRDLMIDFKHFVNRKTESLPGKPHEEFPSEDRESASSLWYSKAERVLFRNLNELKFGRTEVIVGAVGSGAIVNSRDFISLGSAVAIALVWDGIRRINKNEEFISKIFETMRENNIYVISKKAPSINKRSK